MIIIGIGANLDYRDPDHRGPGDCTGGTPRETCGRALESLSNMAGIRILKRSRWYWSAPVIRSASTEAGRAVDQPWYVNGAVSIATEHQPHDLLASLMAIEAACGRVRPRDKRDSEDAPRTIDLDLVDYHGRVMATDTLTIPHPRLHQRAFVVLPLFDLNRDWTHPVTGASVASLRTGLTARQQISVLDDGTGLFGTEWGGEQGDNC